MREEEEFFDAWDEQGWPDYHPVTGEPIYPKWDEAAGKWDYSHRDELYGREDTESGD